ncbi:hypothetical protein [Massilia niastensis]|uniref:hypothetical protein n=1 Tax=Massilia niastensis TaxID=544911 RepID=UPI000365B9C8|nr:hypothetical protein [Massilia niastensis]
MRPSDEHQAAFTRPNLMSASHRAGAEDSILAKLERDSPRRHGTRPAARLAWYAASALVAIALAGTLAWLAAGNGKPVAEAETLVLGPARSVAQAPALVAETPPEPPPLRLLEEPKAAPRPARAVVPAPVRPPAAAKLDARPAPTARPGPAAARTAPRQPVRQARAAAPVRPAEPAVDSDVALISALIVYANGHAEAPGEEAPACTDDNCRPRPPRP